MIRKMKSVFCGILAAAILSALFVMPAGAESTGYISIDFYKPADWTDTVNIHLWNAGSADTQWPGAAMKKVENGKYRYTTTAAGSVDFVINDGSGKQTSDLHAEGDVTVKDDTVIEKCKTQTRLNFKKPSGWSDDVRFYYYTNDGKGISFTAWPGTKMSKNSDGSYYATIYDMADARVMFTDGTHQYPAALQEGINVKDGEELLFQDGKYTVNKHSWIRIDQPFNTAYVNDSVVVKAIMDVGSDLPLMFYDTDKNAYVEPEGYTEIRENGKVIRNYTFKFSEAGVKNLEVRYYYHSGVGYTDQTVNFKVLEHSEYETIPYIFVSDKYDVNMGEEFTVTVKFNSSFYYTLRNEKGEVLTPKKIETIYEGEIPAYDAMTFTADQIGQYQKLYFYQHVKPYPIPQDTGSFVTINVWQPV